MGFFGAKQSDSDPESCAEFCFTHNSEPIKTYYYHLPSSKHTKLIRKNFNAKILKIQAIYILATILAFLFTFYLRYFIVSISESAQV